MPLKDLTGQRFGKLIVVNRASTKIDKSGKHRTMWECICDCGNPTVVSRDYLKRSKCPSCGCEVIKSRVENNRVNNIGEKFGRLTIVDILWGCERAKAVCVCDCGNNYVQILLLDIHSHVDVYNQKIRLVPIQKIGKGLLLTVE